MTENVIIQSASHQLTVWHDKIMFHLSRYTLYITQSHVLARNQMYASRENVTTFVMRWYIYGILLHLQKPMAPVNVTTHHKCINGTVMPFWIRNWYLLTPIRYRLKMCVTIDIYMHISNCCWSTLSGISRLSPLPDYYIYGVFQWKLKIEMATNVITQHTLHRLSGHPTQYNPSSRNTHYI